jgi:hypothetical protein
MPFHLGRFAQYIDDRRGIAGGIVLLVKRRLLSLDFQNFRMLGSAKLYMSEIKNLQAPLTVKTWIYVRYILLTSGHFKLGRCVPINQDVHKAGKSRSKSS